MCFMPGHDVLTFVSSKLLWISNDPLLDFRFMVGCGKQLIECYLSFKLDKPVGKIIRDFSTYNIAFLKSYVCLYSCVYIYLKCFAFCCYGLLWI